jgi:hypothetical protein
MHEESGEQGRGESEHVEDDIPDMRMNECAVDAKHATRSNMEQELQASVESRQVPEVDSLSNR